MSSSRRIQLEQVTKYFSFFDNIPKDFIISAPKIIITLIFLFLPSFLFAISNQFPIYPGAKDIKEYSLKNGLIKGVSYRVKIPYPAQEVLDFYEKEMRKMGYIPFVEEAHKYSDRTWQTFQDGTKSGSPYVNQLIAYWVNPQKTKRVILALRYYYYYVKPNNSKLVLGYNDDLEVIFQIMPFFQISPFEDILKKKGDKE